VTLDDEGTKSRPRSTSDDQRHCGAARAGIHSEPASAGDFMKLRLLGPPEPWAVLLCLERELERHGDIGQTHGNKDSEGGSRSGTNGSEPYRFRFDLNRNDISQPAPSQRKGRASVCVVICASR
jgi:hypothetical protein